MHRDYRGRATDVELRHPFLKILNGEIAGDGIVFKVVANEFGVIAGASDHIHVFEVVVSDVIVLVAVFDVGEETFLEAVEDAGVLVEVGKRICPCGGSRGCGFG